MEQQLIFIAKSVRLMKKISLHIVLLVTLFLSVNAVLNARIPDTSFIPKAVTAGNTKADLVLPKGFTATVIATGYGGVRHIAVTRSGGIYIKLSRLKDGKGIYYLKDTNGDGIIDVETGFGNYPGTGIFIKDGYLYASSNDDVYRYKLNEKDEVINPEKPEKIIKGLVNHDRDNSKSITVDDNENIYVNVGSYTNACLEGNSLVAKSPCPLLDSVGGIWQFKTNKINQGYKDAVHYATGLKNVVGLDWNTRTKSLFVMQHGRDQLHDLYPKYFTEKQNSYLPAETMYEVHKGFDGGWPYVYYDQIQHKKILAPEYGGDGKKAGGGNAANPVAVFPAHLAPNGLLFYTGHLFPSKYKNGAFIAFHNKSPELEKGFLVAFVPFNSNKPSGKWEIFADDFAGHGYNKSNQPAMHKPCGLAQGADGALYVTDDMGGFIYKIYYHN